MWLTPIILFLQIILKLFAFHCDNFRAKITEGNTRPYVLCVAGIETAGEDPNVPVGNNGIKLGHPQPCN